MVAPPAVFAVAAQLFQQGELRKAWQALRPALPDLLTHADAQQLAGQILKGLGQYEDALEYLRRSAELAPGHAIYRTNLANTFAALDLPEMAIPHYETALSIAPDFRSALLGYGRASLDAGATENAAAVADTLTTNSEQDSEAWNLKARIFLARENHGEAEACARRALDIAPDYVAAEHTLASIHIERANPALARQALDRIRTNNIATPELLTAYARVAIIEGDTNAARDQLVVAAKRYPQNEDIQVLFAKVRHLIGDTDFTQAIHQEVARQRPDSKLRLLEARLLRGAGRLDEALQVLVPVIDAGDSSGSFAAFMHEAASVHLDAGRYEQARNAADTAWRVAPEITEMIAQLAQCLLCIGDGEQALALIQKLRQRQPHDQRFLAFESSCARLIDTARYNELCDYNAFVDTFLIETPKGWSSLPEFLAELRAELEVRHANLHTPLDQSLRFGTQTPASLLNSGNRVIAALIEAFDRPIRTFRTALGSHPHHPLTSRNVGDHQLRGCWSVRLRQSGYHVNHVHPQGWISSAFYVEVPAETRDQKQKSGWLKFGEPRYPIPGATIEHTVAPIAGQLALFPSYFWHGTTPLENNFARISVAFDVVPG